MLAILSQPQLAQSFYMQQKGWEVSTQPISAAVAAAGL